MKYRMILIFVIFFLCYFSLPAQTTLSGLVKGGDEPIISLYVIDDFITGKEVHTDQSALSPEGHFTLSVDVKQVRYAVLRVGYYSAGLYLEPGKNYTLDISYEPVDFFINPNLVDTPLSYSIRDEIFEGLNTNIALFNGMYDDFILAHFQSLYRSRDKTLLDEFQSEVDKAFAGYHDSYFEQYVRYRIASIEFQTHLKSRHELAEAYFTGRPLYFHDEAMAFFTLFYSKYLVSSSRYITSSDLECTINDLASTAALMDTLGKDPVLRNEVWRELVMLFTLNELLSDRNFGYDQLISMLRRVATTSKFPEHRLIAENCLEKAGALTPGSTAPELSVNGTPIWGREAKPFLMVCFFQTWNGACQAEMELLKNVAEGFDAMEVIMISADEQESLFLEWQASDTVPWLSFWFANDYDLLNAYNARSFPLFVLLSDDGKIVYWDMPRPSEGMEVLLTRFFGNEQ